MAKKRYNKKRKDNKLTIIPILLVLCLLPLIVYAKIIDYDTSSLNWYTDPVTKLVDIFNYYKAALLILCASIMMIALIIQTLQKTKTHKLNYKLYSPAIVYVFLVVLSTFFSISTYYSLNGYVNHLENIYVLIAYIIVFVYTAETVSNRDHIDFIVKGWVVSIVILFLIGLTQFLGFDIYRTDIGFALIIPPALKQEIAGADFTLWKDNLIYQSLFHYNYVSFYSAVAFPFFLTLFIGRPAIKQRLIYGGIMAILIFNLIGSQGRNGFLGILLGCIIILLFFGKKMIFNKYTIGIVGALVLFIVVFVSFTDTILENRIKSAFTGFGDYIDYPLNDLRTEADKIVVDHDSLHMTVTISGDKGDPSFIFSNAENKAIQTGINDEGYITFIPPEGDENNYSIVTARKMIYQTYDVLQLNLEDQDWNFIYDGKSVSYLNAFGKIEQLTEVKAIGFTGIERWGSQRGYIWSRTLPLLFERPILGYGPDTFTIAFPQKDYVGKLNAFRTTNKLVDKPHNIFLNYAVNTGIPSMIAIICLIAIAYWRTFINYLIGYRRTTGSEEPRLIGIATLGAITGYIGAGMFNDTSLHVTPIFWVLMGLNYAVNSKRWQQQS